MKIIHETTSQPTTTREATPNMKQVYAFRIADSNHPWIYHSSDDVNPAIINFAAVTHAEAIEIVGPSTATGILQLTSADSLTRPIVIQMSDRPQLLAPTLIWKASEMFGFQQKGVVILNQIEIALYYIDNEFNVIGTMTDLQTGNNNQSGAQPIKDISAAQQVAQYHFDRFAYLLFNACLVKK